MSDDFNFPIINNAFGTQYLSPYILRTTKAFTSEFRKEENPICKTDLDWVKSVTYNTKQSRVKKECCFLLAFH
jgi:hypothetical protein